MNAHGSHAGGKTLGRETWLSTLLTIGLLGIAIACLSPRIMQLLGNRPAVASLSTTSSSSTLELITKPIEDIRCGDRIPSELPDGVEASRDQVPNAATWRLVELEVAKQSGEKIEVKLLRPLAWLEQAGAIQNGTFAINVQELDIEGQAAVLKILPCPPIQTGQGQVVTGTFCHSCDEFVELHIDGENAPITCTTGHPIWSERHQDFIDAAKLQAGDPVRLVSDRLSRIAHVRQFHQPQNVYNLEINATHVYHVGENGLLVHNGKVFDACDANDDDTPPERQSKSRSGGARKPGTQGEMGNNQHENQLAKAVADRVGLDKSQRDRFHDAITGEGISKFDVLREIAQRIFDGEL